MSRSIPVEASTQPDNGRLSRRTMLRAAGAGVALPLLDAMVPVFGRAARAAAKAGPPRRLVTIHVPLGMMPQFFFPSKPSSGPSSPYLNHLAAHRGQFTVFSGLSHPEVRSGHSSSKCFLTGARNPGHPTFRNSLSLDQLVAESIGVDTRFRSLTLAVQKKESPTTFESISVSRVGVGIPPELSPQRLYRDMFVTGTPEEKAATLRRITAGGSVLDLVGDRAAQLERKVGPADRARLDQYFTSVRELEGRLGRKIDWQGRPKPKVDYAEPNEVVDANMVIEKSKLMYDMIRLAMETDTTRVVALMISLFSTTAHLPGVKTDTHALTHHGNEPEKVAELRKVEEAQMRAFGGFLQSLRDVGEDGGTLLDHTQVLYGSCLGNANMHSNTNMPIIQAGGGYSHPGRLAFDENNNEPLANLYVTMLRRLGIEADSFATSTGSLRGLDA